MPEKPRFRAGERGFSSLGAAIPVNRGPSLKMGLPMKLNSRLNKKFARFCMALAVLAPLCAAHKAQAEPKPWIWSWYHDHFIDQHFQPYINDPRHPYNSQWDYQNWTPGNWIETTRNKEEMKLIRDFYFADILRKQDTRQGIPAVVVGPAFYELGGQDKRRVMDTVDHVYGITRARANGIFTVYDWYTKKPIGVYSRDGLYLQ
jgi:hypothetical protein